MITPDDPPPSCRLPPRRVVILATPSAQSLEVAGPVEVFAMAALKLREAGRTLVAGYAVEVVSAVNDPHIRSPAGLTLLAHRAFTEVDYEIDTLLVAGGMEVWSGADQPGLLRWVRERSRRARRFGSVCTGAFLLAEAGLLDARRVTTHWYFCQQLQREYPRAVVDPEPIFIREDNLYTSAGVASGLDLALSMVEEDYGQDIALRIARALVLFLRRPGGQNQFSTALAFQESARVPMRELPIYVLEHLAEPLTVERPRPARGHERAQFLPGVPAGVRLPARSLRRAAAPGGGPPTGRGERTGPGGHRRRVRPGWRGNAAPRLRA